MSKLDKEFKALIESKLQEATNILKEVNELAHAAGTTLNLIALTKVELLKDILFDADLLDSQEGWESSTHCY